MVFAAPFQEQASIETEALKLGPHNLHFGTISISEIRRRRHSKHAELTRRILRDLDNIDPGTALKIPATALLGTKVENVRAALNREVKAGGFKVGTRISDDYFYVWRKLK